MVIPPEIQYRVKAERTTQRPSWSSADENAGLSSCLVARVGPRVGGSCKGMPQLSVT